MLVIQLFEKRLVFFLFFLIKLFGFVFVSIYFCIRIQERVLVVNKMIMKR